MTFHNMQYTNNRTTAALESQQLKPIKNLAGAEGDRRNTGEDFPEIR